MRILFVFIVSCFATFIFASDQPDGIDYADYENLDYTEPTTSRMVLKQNYHDFGSIEFGENFVHHFEFMNQGLATLVIEEVFTESEGALIFNHKTEIAPGEKGWISVEFNSGLEIGKFSKWFFVRSNSGGKKTLMRLEIKYELSEYLSIGGDNVGAQDKVNVRELPRLNSPVMAQLERGDSCRILGDDMGDYVEKFDDSYWFKVEVEGKEGWVLSALTEF